MNKVINKNCCNKSLAPTFAMMTESFQPSGPHLYSSECNWILVILSFFPPSLSEREKILFYEGRNSLQVCLIENNLTNLTNPTRSSAIYYLNKCMCMCVCVCVCVYIQYIFNLKTKIISFSFYKKRLATW